MGQARRGVSPQVRGEAKEKGLRFLAWLLCCFCALGRGGEGAGMRSWRKECGRPHLLSRTAGRLGLCGVWMGPWCHFISVFPSEAREALSHHTSAGKHVWFLAAGG